MRDAAITNGRGSTPSTPTSQEDAFLNAEDPPFSLPAHEGYTLLENSNNNDNSTSSRSSSSENDEENGIAWNRDHLNDVAVDEALRRALNSDEIVFGTFPASVEPECIPDESSPALLWRTPMNGEDRRIPLPEEKAAEIKACLRDFQLPDASLPTWAKQIPEEMWKQRLLQLLSSSSSSNLS